jgi:hypothetical protein
MNTTVSQTAYDGTRTDAGTRCGVMRAIVIAFTTSVTIGDSPSRSAMIQTPNVTTNCITFCPDTLWMRGSTSAVQRANR